MTPKKKILPVRRLPLADLPKISADTLFGLFKPVERLPRKKRDSFLDRFPLEDVLNRIRQKIEAEGVNPYEKIFELDTKSEVISAVAVNDKGYPLSQLRQILGIATRDWLRKNKLDKEIGLSWRDGRYLYLYGKGDVD